MDMLSTLLALCNGDRPKVSPHKSPAMPNIWAFLCSYPEQVVRWPMIWNVLKVHSAVTIIKQKCLLKYCETKRPYFEFNMNIIPNCIPHSTNWANIWIYDLLQNSVQYYHAGIFHYHSCGIFMVPFELQLSNDNVNDHLPLIQEN